jgi:hypothetical protein
MKKQELIDSILDELQILNEQFDSTVDKNFKSQIKIAISNLYIALSNIIKY